MKYCDDHVWVELRRGSNGLKYETVVGGRGWADTEGGGTERSEVSRGEDDAAG